MIEVMWIDDEWEDKGIPFIASAENEGIDIAPFDTYTKGLEALKKEPKKWVAVILDIREQAAEQGAATDNFHIAREQLKEFQILNHQTEPYVFVLTGEPNYLDSDAFPKVDYARKRVYSKSLEDYKLLFEDIKKITKYSDLYQVRQEYKNVLYAAESYFKVDNDTYNRLFALIQKVIYNRIINNAKMLNEIRKLCENMIFPKLKELGYIPDEINKKGMNETSKYINQDERYPEYVKRSIHSVVSITQRGSHGNTTIDKDVSEGRAPYLLRSCLYELLNIIIWMKDQK